MRMSSTRSALLLLGAGFVTLCVGVVILELMFGHWLRSGSWSDVERMNVVRNQQLSYDVGHIYGPDAKPIRYTRDEYGLRGSCREPERIDIVTLGGSTTDQVYIADGQTWQDVLQQRINASRPDSPVCVANAGVDGHTTFGHIAALERWFPLIPKFRPRYYLLYIGINDAALRSKQSAFDENADASDIFAHAKGAIKNNSALYGLIHRLHRPGSGDGPVFAAHKLVYPKDADYTSTESAPDIQTFVHSSSTAFAERLLTILRGIKGRGGKPICVSQPSIIYKHFDDGWRGIPNVFSVSGHQFNGLDYRASILSLNGVMASECTKAGGHYIDLEGRPFALTDYYDGVHLSPAGAAKVGEYLFDEFQRQFIMGLRPAGAALTPR